MKKLILPTLLLAVLVLIGFRLHSELEPSNASSPAANGLSGRPAMLVGTAEARPHLFVSNLERLGELAPLASVDIMSRVSGRLREVLVERGDPVRMGQLLAVVEDDDLLRQIRRAEAAIAVTRASVSREVATYENLAVQVNRYKKLHAESLISIQELQDLESRLRVSAAQVELAKAQVDQTEASLSELKLQHEQTKVFSPLDGFVSTRFLYPGALVSTSVAIGRVIDVSRVKTLVPVTEGILSEVHVGLQADVKVDAFPSRQYRGQITRISPFLDPETRTADVEIEIDNPSQELKPGMFARVSIEARKPKPSLAINRSALLTRGSLQGVFLLDEELTTRFVPITVGRIQGDFVEVLEGLDEGTRVVTSGAQKLNEGDKVKIS
jgi:HlyD family secretion protein